MVDIVLLNYNDCFMTQSFVERVSKYSNVDHIAIVDNCSTDNSFAVLSQYDGEKVHVIQTGKNIGYGEGNNYGIRYLWENCHSKYILLSNPDVVINEEVIEMLEKTLKENKDYAVIAPWMKNKAGVREECTAWEIPTMTQYIASFGMLSRRLFSSEYKDLNNSQDMLKTVGAVAGSLFMFNTEIFLKQGLFDERIFLYGEENVLGIKMRNAGYKVGLLTQESFLHIHGSSTKKTYKSEIQRNRILAKSKLYILKKYFSANKIQYAIGMVASKVFLAEVIIWSMIKPKIQQTD